MALCKESRKLFFQSTNAAPARLNKEKTMKRLFVKEKPVRNVFIVLLALAILTGLIWMTRESLKPQSVVETKISVPQKPVVVAARAIPPCPEKNKVHLKKKKVQQPKSAPPATSKTLMASGMKGCVEIRFTTKPGDTVVKFPVFGPTGPDIAKDSCTGIKRSGDSTFGSWRNGFCSTALPILCDFSQHERIIGQKVRLMGSYRIEKQGEHVIRLPGYITEKQSGYVTALILVRGKSEHPDYPSEQPGDTKAFVAAYTYGEQRQEWIANNSDAMGVRWFDYTNGVARVYYSKAEVPKDAAQLYWPWGEWRGP